MFFCYVRVFFQLFVDLKKKKPKNHQLTVAFDSKYCGLEQFFSRGEVASNCFSHEVGFAKDLVVCWFLCARWGIPVCWLSVVGASMASGAVALCSLGLMDPV